LIFQALILVIILKVKVSSKREDGMRKIGEIAQMRFLWLFLTAFLVFSLVGTGWCDEETEPCTVMYPDRETRLRWIKAYEDAPRAYIDEALELSIPLTGSYSLLSHLDYVPAERNQGACGNCWAWAGTGVMEVALDVEESIFDRLSVQYLNSCDGIGADYACCGGWLADLADFYTATGLVAVPWSNTNASWADGGRSCAHGSSLVSCASISTSPNYPIDFIDEQTITTHGVGQATAIANIKNVLHQNRAVWFGFFMPTKADGDNFKSFWNNQGETVIWNPDFSCGHTWSQGWGHAVLCVGYNDDDPNNRYWVIVNSWGTAGGGRPNGIFRLDMDMNYDCTFYDGALYYSFYWQTLDIDYGSIVQPKPDLVVLSMQTDPVEPDPGETVNVYVTVKNQGSANASNFQIDWYADRGIAPGPGEYGDLSHWVKSYLAPGATYTTPGMAYSGYSSPGIYDMAAQVDAGQHIDEADEDNNVLWPVPIWIGVCECDLNHDGRCDMQDWLLFGQDWGRTDCPMPSMTKAAKKVAPNNSPTGDPDQVVQEGATKHRLIRVQNSLPDGYQPGSTGQKGRPRRAVPSSNAEERNPVPSFAATPLWQGLERLSQADRDNATLQLEVSEDLAPSVLEECKAIERLWNSGNFAGAIEALRALEADGVAVAAAINWKTPRAVDGLEWWDDDVRIGARKYIYQKVLDFDAQTGNLFAVLKYYEGYEYYWSVNLSTDDGQTWQETYTWWSSQWIVDVDIAVMGSHLYVAYVDEVYPTRAKLRRFYTSNGASDTGYDHLTVFDKGTNLWEIALTSNVDSVLSSGLKDRIYYLAISNYNLYFYWGSGDGTTWTEQSTGINYAYYGLDACWNELYEKHPAYVSFVGFIIGQEEQDLTPLFVGRWDVSGWEAYQFSDEPPPGTNTAVAAYDDRAMVVFEAEYTNDSGVKYWVSYDAGDNWYWGNIGIPASAGNYFAGPDVAGRKGGGFAVVYAEEAGAFDPCWYRHRDYGTGPGTAPWSLPEQYNGLDILSLEDLAAEWVPPLPDNTYAHGSIYPASDAYAYFDRSDGIVDICECDLNHDGQCDMQDWLLFGRDWGRTDCPILLECVPDQEQLVDNYGYWFEEKVVRWQEFFPEGNWICRVGIEISRAGNPQGDVLVAIEEKGGTTVWSTIVPRASVPIGMSWVSVDVPNINVTSGGSYTLKVWSNGPSPDARNRYFWQSSDSDVYPGSSSVGTAADFTFRTHKGIPASSS
jgi:hypothetical protein